jgi:ketosteroid isomerase-like protein
VTAAARPAGQPARGAGRTGRGRTTILLAAAFLLGVALPAVAGEGAATARVPTVTRLVKIFLELEGELAAGLRGGNAAAVERLLADDFELRVASMPGNPTPRAEWLRLALGKPGPAVSFEQMAVHEYGDTAIVSFLQVPLAKASRDPTRDIATVDVWKRAGEGWSLAVRYAGPAGRRDFAIPGASNEPPVDKRY